MFTNVLRCGRRGALAGVCAAGLMVAAGASAGPALAQPQVPAHVRAAGLAQAKVPWSKVGSGWELVQYATTVSGAATLYLVGPNGARYAMRSPASSTLIAWSGDKTRALFFDDDSGTVTQLNLTTGKTSSFTLTGQTFPIAYTQPHGLNILALRDNDGFFTLERVNLTGKLQKVLLSGKDADAAVYNPNGETLAVPGSKGVRLVNNASGAVKNLNVPGTDTKVGCGAVRWWNSSTILAYCYGANEPFISRLWLVPASGAKPTALTPQRKGGYDYGDIDAWRLSSGLYLQSLGACGTIEINKQAANGSISPVNVPGTSNTHNVIVTADGPRLLIDPSVACQPGAGLAWFNPGTHAEQWLFRYAAHAVLAVVPFDNIEDAPAI